MGLSYHDLHITTPTIKRTSIFNLPHCLQVSCRRVDGWVLIDQDAKTILAGEYEGPDNWLILDIGKGKEIVNSRPATIP
jgi:hypothetical protein